MSQRAVGRRAGGASRELNRNNSHLTTSTEPRRAARATRATSGEMCIHQKIFFIIMRQLASSTGPSRSGNISRFTAITNCDASGQRACRRAANRLQDHALHHNGLAACRDSAYNTRTVSGRTNKVTAGYGYEPKISEPLLIFVFLRLLKSFGITKRMRFLREYTLSQ